jgi:hypothetical protein
MNFSAARVLESHSPALQQCPIFMTNQGFKSLREVVCRHLRHMLLKRFARRDDYCVNSRHNV